MVKSGFGDELITFVSPSAVNLVVVTVDEIITELELAACVSPSVETASGSAVNT